MEVQMCKDLAKYQSSSWRSKWDLWVLAKTQPQPGSDLENAFYLMVHKTTLTIGSAFSPFHPLAFCNLGDSLF